MNNAQSLAVKIAELLTHVSGLIIERKIVKRAKVYYSDGNLLTNLGNNVHFELYSFDKGNPVFSIDTKDKYSGPIFENGKPDFDHALPHNFERRVDVWVNHFSLSYNWQNDYRITQLDNRGHAQNEAYLDAIDDIVRYSDAVQIFKSGDLDYGIRMNKVMKRIVRTQDEMY